VVERRKLVTSVFCDLAGSTELGEQADSEIVFELMRSYFDTARTALERHGGAVEKFIGDAVVGMFGVPEAHEDDALRACRAALEIQERLAALELGIAVRIGVNTGEVVAGDAARREMFASGDAVVLGDSVNVAARLEQAAAPGQVLLGEATYRLVRDAVRAEPVDPIAAKGKSEPLVAFRLREASTHGPIPRASSSRLVGRADELALLEAELDAALAGRPRLVTIVGEAGVGKSRLTAELMAQLGHRARVAKGVCLSYGDGITFWAVAQIVRELAGITDDDTIDVARSKVPGRLAQVLGLADGSTTAEQTADAIAEFLEEAAAAGPLVVLVDDIHWAEPALLDLLESLPRRVSGPLMLVGLARPELVEHRPGWPVTVPLEPLRAAEIDALLDELHAPAGVRVRVAQASAGNPLFAEELVAWVNEGGELDEMPTSLNALLGARLDRLGQQERDVIERGAVEGELFHQEAIVELSDEPARPAVPNELGRLARKDLIRLAAATVVAGGAAYRFKHILVREAAYLATTKKARAALHERFADWLERLAGERIGEYHEILGYHLEQAYRYRAELGETDAVLAARAGGHLGAGGRRANDRGDVRAAASLLARAIELLPVDSRERLALMLPYQDAARESGRKREQTAAQEELRDRGRALGERRFAAYGVMFRSDRQADWDACIETFQELGDDIGLALAMRQKGMAYGWSGDGVAGTEWLERAFEHGARTGDAAAFRRVTQSLAMILTRGPTPVELAIVRCVELQAASADDRVLEAVVTRCIGNLLAMAGRFDEALEHADRAGRVLDDANMTISSRASQVMDADTRVLAGDRAGAERSMRARWRFFEEISVGLSADPHGIESGIWLAGFYADDGRWDKAETYVSICRDVVSTLNPNRIGYDGADRTVEHFLIAEARLAAHRGELAEALDLAEHALACIARADEPISRANTWLVLADIHRARGNQAEASAAVAKALALYEKKGNVAAASQLRSARVG
jgi:class 3 adenylate cyclase/tetratricopeptide (TPR) repeat protein